MFDLYVSNTAAPTGTNFILKKTDGRKSFKVFVKPQNYGKFNWRFFFMNKVNSTFAQGDESYRNMDCGNWKIYSASISWAENVEPNGNSFDKKEVLFDGKKGRSVNKDDEFWTDPVEFEIPKGFLIWEWEIEGEMIPTMPDDIYSKFVLDGNKYVHCDNVPSPALFGCDKKVKKKVAFIGDSITAGCGTPCDKYEMWVARISEMIKDEYSVWNLGLGFGRGSDFATLDSWFEKAKVCDVVIMAYGVNDLISGSYKVGRSSSASEFIADYEKIITALKENNVEIIISTIPPFHYSDTQKREWRCANMAIYHLAKMYGCKVYDIESSLDTKELNNDRPTGDHPDSSGGELAANKFKKTFLVNGKWEI